MRRLLLVICFMLFAPSAFAQCTGVFTTGQICGSVSGGPPTAAFTAGASGHTIPFLDGSNTWSATQTFTASQQIILGANGGNVGAFILKGSTSGQSVIQTDATGATIYMVLSNASQSNTLCYNTSTGALTYVAGVNCSGATGGFRANLNASNWTFTTPNTNTYVLMPLAAVAYNINSYYVVYPGSYSTANPPTNTKFTPPSGTNLVCFGGSVLVDSGVKSSGGNAVIKVIKNFTVNSSGTEQSGTDVVEAQGGLYMNASGTARFTLSGCDKPSPSDYYGLFIYIDGPSGSSGGDSIVVDGNNTHT